MDRYINLLRYVFTSLILAGSISLLFMVMKRMYWRNKICQMPVPGCFLRIEKTKTQKLLPLFHTTRIGRSSRSDHVIESKNMPLSQLVIFRFNDLWYLRPISKKIDTIVNGKKINSKIQIHHNDVIQIGTIKAVFVDEERASLNENKVFDEAKAVREAETYMIKKISRGDKRLNLKKVEKGLTQDIPVFAWICINIFNILGFAYIFLNFPSNEKQYFLPWLITSVVFFVFMNLYFLLLPLYSRLADRTIFISGYFLMSIGMIFQARLAFVNRTGLLKAIEDNNQADIASLLDYVQNQFSNQGMSMLISLAIFPIVIFVVSRFNLLEKLAPLCMVLTPLLYLATFIFGKGMESHGASLWIHIPGFGQIQLTEVAKVTYLIVLAVIFKNRPPFKTQVLFGIWGVFNYILIMLLPDIGSVMILVPTTMIVYVIMTSEYIKAGIAIVLAGGVATFIYMMFDHVQRRLSGWQNLWIKMTPENDQIIRGLKAIARGGLFGLGLGKGSPSSVPAAVDDMVFAVLCEEFGFLFIIGIVILFLNIWLASANTALTAADGFASGLSLSFGTLLFIEAILIIAGSSGLLPLSGFTLPFIARGGSSLMIKVIMLATLIGLSARPGFIKARINKDRG